MTLHAYFYTCLDKDRLSLCIVQLVLNAAPGAMLEGSEDWKHGQKDSAALQRYSHGALHT